MTLHIITSLLVCAVGLPQVEVTTLDDKAVRGEVVSLSASTLALRTDDGDVMLPVVKLLSVTPTSVAEADPVKSPVFIELIDGTLISALNYEVKSGRATVKLPGDQSLSLSARSVRSVRFLQQDEPVAELWTNILAGALKGDAVVVRKGGDGKPVKLDYLEGIIQDVSAAKVQFDFEGDVVPVNRQKVRVEGLIYFQPKTQSLPGPVCRVDTTGGARWMASDLRFEKDAIKLTTPTGVDVGVPLSRVTNLDFSLGKIVYLSDLTPIKKTWQPFFGVSKTTTGAAAMFDARGDENFAGEPLQLGDQPFRKGLAMHSRSELTYRLPDAYSRFEAVVGIDPAQRSFGNVRLQIEGDGKVLYDKPIAGDQPPESLELDISGVGRLTILVDYGEGLDIGDQLILGGARVIR